MSRPPSVTNKSQPHRNASVPRESGGGSMDHSEVAKSRISNQQPTPKKTNTKERMKNYSNMQRNKQNQRQEPLDRQKVIEQNNKLKTQINELLQHIDMILEREREKREQAIQKNHQREQDEEILELQDLLRTQEREIGDNKVTIKMLSRQLENTYEINKVVDKENEIRHKQSELKQLKEEEESLNKIIRNQRDALNYLNNKQEYDIQLGEVKKNLAKAKEVNRGLAEELLMAEKQLQKVREQNITKQKKAQELEDRIREAKKNPVQKVTQQMVDQLEKEVKLLEAQKNEEEKQIREQLKILEAEKHERKIELEKTAIKFSSMEKEMRLNRIIISESAKLMRIQQSEALEKPADSEKRTGSSYKPNLMRRQGQASREKGANAGNDTSGIKRSDSKSSLGKQEKPKTPTKLQEKKQTPEKVEVVQKAETQQQTPVQRPASSDVVEENYDENEFESDQTPKPETPVDPLEEPIDDPKPDVYSKPSFMIKKKQ